MFLVSGIMTKEDDLDFSQTIICPNCGAYDKISGFFTYRVFTIFFLPIFKWNKEYYMVSRCCNSIFKIGRDLGRDIERVGGVRLLESDLSLVSKGHRDYTCGSCGGIVEGTFDYCPKCGGKL